MMSSLNLFLTLLLIPGSLLLLRYYFKLRDRGHKTEILEIKLRALQKKIDHEKLEISEVHKRLEEQKIPLEKKWDEIQAGDKILENKAIKLQQDRETLEKQKYEIDRLRIQLKENQERIEAVNQHLKIKWEHERQEIEIRKNELTTILKQIKIEKANTEAQKKQIRHEQQMLLDERKEIAKKIKQSEILKIYFENQQKAIDDEKANLRKEQDRTTKEKQKLQHEIENNKQIQKKINEEAGILKKKAAELFVKENSIATNYKQFEHEKSEFKHAKLEFEKLIRRTTIYAIKQIKERRRESVFNQPIDSDNIQNQATLLQNSNLASQDIILEVHSWRMEDTWRFALNVFSLNPKNSNFQIVQEDKVLSKVEFCDNQWLINSFSPVIIRWREKNESKEKLFDIIPNHIDSLLLFKKEFPNHGRLMKYLSNGCYLMVVPEEWNFDATLSCLPVGEKECTSIHGYVAHNINLTKTVNSIIVYRKADEKSLCFARQQNRFCISGRNNIDMNEDEDPLFCSKLPCITDKEKLWKDVRVIILRDHECKFQKIHRLLTSEIMSPDLDLNLLENRGEGALNKNSNFNLLCDIYDQFNNLLESIGLRFIDCLKAVTVSDYPTVPGIDGHEPVRIEFMHDQNCEIKLSEGDNVNVKLKSNDTGTLANIFPSATLDVTNWIIQDNLGRKTTLTIRLNMIWWQLINNSSIPQKPNANGAPLFLLLNELKNSTDSGIYIWVPPTFEGKNFFIGLQKDSAKEFERKKEEPGFFVPLKSILDGENFNFSNKNLKLKMWTEREDENIILANLILKQYICKIENCDFKTTNKNEMNLHIKEAHLVHLIKELSYHEIRSKYNEELPVEIYQCSYCKNYIFAEQDTENPVFSIINHINQCPKVSLNNGNPFISFRIVNNLQELKNLALPEIPVVLKCLLCNKLFKNPGEDEMYDHFMQFHEHDLIGEAKDGLPKLENFTASI